MKKHANHLIECETYEELESLAETGRYTIGTLSEVEKNMWVEAEDWEVHDGCITVTTSSCQVIFVYKEKGDWRLPDLRVWLKCLELKEDSRNILYQYVLNRRKAVQNTMNDKKVKDWLEEQRSLAAELLSAIIRDNPDVTW